MAYGPMSTPRRPAPRSMGTPTMPTARPCWLARGGLLTGLIVVEAATGLAPEIACRDHLPQQGRGGKPRVFELVEQDIGNVQRGVQADEVQQREWAHRVTGAEQHAQV